MTDENIPEEGAAKEPGQENIGAVAEEASDAGEVVEEGAAEESAAEEASEDGAQPDSEESEETPDTADKVVNEGDASEGDAEEAMLAMLEDLPQEDSGAKPEDINFGTAEVSGAEFQQLSEPSGKGESRNIDILKDVNLPVAIELGRTKMTISDILALGPGSVVELNKLAGEPVDVLVNNKAVAKGEVVVIDENFGVRITQLLTPEERLKLLGDEQ